LSKYFQLLYALVKPTGRLLPNHLSSTPRALECQVHGAAAGGASQAEAAAHICGKLFFQQCGFRDLIFDHIVPVKPAGPQYFQGVVNSRLGNRFLPLMEMNILSGGINC
jgi:hypothetical protein